MFGPRQDPNGPYAAVIPRWIKAIKNGEPVQIYGDGKTSRDFCYVDNAVQANLLAGLTKNKKALNQIYNVACGRRTTLNDLYSIIQSIFHAGVRGQLPGGDHPLSAVRCFPTKIPPPRYLPERAGDARHSLADTAKARERFGYLPAVQFDDGIASLCATDT